MNNTTSGADAGLEALTHPLVLKAAWMRIEDWYRSGNLAPEPELSRWRLHPEAELGKLGSALRAGKWRPSRWPQIPYPKKGACLRHYVMPTVGDQVAFMAYLVLLGPLLDSRIPNFVFGNRWNRSISWNRRRSPPQWELRPYQLLNHSAYLPYARSHGLFRRVAHWTVARITGAKIEHEDYGGYVQHPDDYDPRHLPRWTRMDWWSPPSSHDARAYWATLDIELAYPSIRLERLRRALVAMIARPRSIEELTLYGGYPRSVLNVLAVGEYLQRIAGGLMDALEMVRVDWGSIPSDAWRPEHARADLPTKKDDGLPTGLAVSGILLNVALCPTDLSVSGFLDDRRHGAIVRFADEAIVMAQSVGGLFDLIEAVWRGLSQSGNALLANPETKSNLHLNWSKIEPESIRDIIACFLKKHGWKECPECQRLYHDSPSKEILTLGKWWNRHGRRNEVSGVYRMAEAIERSAIGAGEVGPFVTTLVARMSEIGRDTLAERFGEGARERLIRLHELARFDIDDTQVRPDTRRAFAANRLVRSWLPPDSERRNLADIRESIAHVIRNTPWKFSLWSPVVRAAARRPQQPNSEDDRTARDWLLTLLGLIAHSPDTRHSNAWVNTWPEDTDNKAHNRDPAWRSLYLSFHRAAFWHALADVLRSLWQHDDEATKPDSAGPAPSRWSVRAIPHGEHANVRRCLGAVDLWTGVLYPHNRSCDLDDRHWELNQLVAATIASASRHDIAAAWRRADTPGDELMVPTGPLWRNIPQTIRILEQCGRVSKHSANEHDLALDTLAYLWLSGRDRRLGDLLFPRNERVRIIEAEADPHRALAAGISLGCSESISAELASALVSRIANVDTIASRLVYLHNYDFTLWEYHRAREILLGQPEMP